VASGATVLALGTTLIAGVSGTGSAAENAPGAPGQQPATWAPANKQGFGTSKTLESKVWYTLQDGGLSEVYYPDLGTPSVRDMQFVVSDGSTFAERESDSTARQAKLLDPKALVYQQVNTAKSGKWRITKTYVTDPDRSTLLLDVDFESLTGAPYRLYAVYNPRLSNGKANENNDTGRTDGDALVAQDDRTGSALVSSPAFAETSSGYLGASDGWTDLRSDYRMDWHHDAQSNGNVVQTGRLPVTGVADSRKATVALGFGGNGGEALSTARASLAAGYPVVSTRYATGWHDYVATLKPPPASLRTDQEKAVYNSSVMVLASHEDKTYRGAFVASPTMPWAWGTNPGLENPSGAYHLVWARDVSGKAGGLMTAGDTAAAQRALHYLFKRQQKGDGSFPQNSKLDGSEHWTNTQMDEVAAPIVLAWTLGKTDPDNWGHVKRAADYIVNNGPVTKQERWENQGGYSPATIAAEIAGLVTAADIAKINGDGDAERRYLAKADEWQAKVKDWTLTTNGPYNPKPYFLRITKDGNPNNGTTYDVGDSGPSAADQRTIVDPSYLELVRLGVLPADDPDIRTTMQVVDAQLAENTPSGQHWHRYNFDGYGERRDGGEWNFGHPQNSRTTLGRLWPLFAGERGEYELAAGQDASARLTAMAATATEGGLLPEQVWNNTAPAGQNGIVAGRPTNSATPLGWAHGQFVRLAWSIQEGRSLSTPSIVACRYTGAGCAGTEPPGAPGKPVASEVTATSVKLTWTAAAPGTDPVTGYDVHRVSTPDTVVVTTTGTSATVTGLRPDTAYRFYVTAKDRTGARGAPSPVTEVRTADGPPLTPPSPPGNPSASGTTSTSTTLTWTASTPGSSPVAGYTVLRRDAGGDVPIANTEATSLQITGLTPATAHRFVVIARGADGATSPPSTPVDVTTTRGGAAKVAYQVQSDWGAGFTAEITITNTGPTPITDWVLAFSFAGDQRLANGWSAQWSQSGQAVTARSEGHNARIGPGDSVTIGFIGSGTATVPTTFTVNGASA
jgi:glucoamylase